MDATRRVWTVLFIGMTCLAGCGDVSMVTPPDGGAVEDAGRPLDAETLADAAPDAQVRADAGPRCAEGEVLCGDRCVSLDDDPHHCGACGVDCDGLPGVAPGLSRCVLGACEITGACAPGRADCEGGAGDGCETDVTTATECGACGAACVAGVEVCSAGEGGAYACTTSCGGATPDRCGDACVDLASNPAQCGSCGTVCPGAPFGTAVCEAGSCAVACDAGHHRCGDACAPDDSVATCGASCAPCPVPANAAATCDGTACGFACLPGYADCDGDASNGCEADLSSPLSCGSCGTDCASLPGVLPGAVGCSAGACSVTGACAPGRADCGGGAADGCETDLTSMTSCGACGVACDAATETCEPSGSGYACTNGCDPSTPTRCGTACADLSSDAANCGACGAACASPSGGAGVCAGGTCDIACDPGRHRCGDACLPDDGVASCGSSCTPCPAPANATATCDGVACGYACLPGFADCDGDPANGCELALSDAAGASVFCEGFEHGLTEWTVGSYWGANTTAYSGSFSLRAYWGGTTSGCGIIPSTYLARDLDLGGATTATLEYRHRAIVGARDNLYVLVSTDGGASWIPVDAPRSSGSWALRTVDLSAYAGSSIRIGFRFSNVCGDADGVTWWVDDVAVHVTR